MKEFKEEILTQLNEEVKNITVISFGHIVNRMGINKLSRQDTMDIVVRFKKENPAYKIYQDVSKLEPLFNQLVFSENEYDDGKEFEDNIE
jgi:ribosomal protein S25